MKVYKFGGASINSIDRIRNTANIIQANKDEKLLVVISAMGKTTNALENLLTSWFENKQDMQDNLLDVIKTMRY